MFSLKRAPIFATGTHHKQEFDEAHLDGIAHAFDALGLAGRVPLKLGHNAEQPLTDGQPALGWVERVWREGSTLYADFKDVPRVVYDAIKGGLYKFVSVELLRNVRADTRTIPFVLDAVALLGADIPAVGTLADLQSLTHSALRGQERLVFTQSFSETFAMNDDTDDLRRENARLRAALHRQTVDAAIEGDVRAKLVQPAAREQFARLFRLSTDTDYQRVTVGDWQTFRASARRPPTSAPATHSDEAATFGALPADASLVEKTRAYLHDNALRHLQLTGERLTFGRAAEIVVRANPQLLAAWRVQNGESD